MERKVTVSEELLGAKFEAFDERQERRFARVSC
jgi:hypothetical protein